MRRALGGRVDDTALVRAARHGDREAFMQLVRVHQAGVRAFAHGLLGDRVLAEDIAQEAFLRAWRGLGAFRGDAAFGTWLYAIARRVVLDEVRRPALRTVPIQEAAALADRRAGDPVLRGDLERALQALEPAQREAFLLVVVLGLSYQEAGGMIGCPAGTVASRVFGPVRGWPPPWACERRIRRDRPRARAADALRHAGRPGRPGAALPG
jgi:RNA polymerase sigma-70 factor (ECF subfamily)